VCETSAVGGTTIRTRAPVVDRQRDGAGALLRRGLAVLSANSFLQIFAASLLAGLVGAVAVRLQLSSTLRLAALGLLLVLVPGPAILNGVFDLAVFRLPLGAARLYATLIGLAALFVFPVFWLVTGSFKPAADTIANPPLIWPQTWTLDNFTQVFTTVPFGRWVFNTASVTGVALLFHSMACAGYLAHPNN